jgi:hypothetical protein
LPLAHEIKLFCIFHELIFAPRKEEQNPAEITIIKNTIIKQFFGLKNEVNGRKQQQKQKTR